MFLKGIPLRLSSKSLILPQSRFYANINVQPLPKTPRPQQDHTSQDPRPPWVYRMSRLVHLIVLPSVAFYCVFFADFGERGEHVFMPARRWAATQKAAFFTLSPAEEKMLRDEEIQNQEATIDPEN